MVKEQVHRGLRLFKDKCGEAEYTGLITVMGDFGDDLNSLFSTNTDDSSCSIDVSTLIPNGRRGWVGGGVQCDDQKNG